jgi:hypothetical protein
MPSGAREIRCPIRRTGLLAAKPNIARKHSKLPRRILFDGRILHMVSIENHIGSPFAVAGLPLVFPSTPYALHRGPGGILNGYFVN